jgi:2-iminobutanoate/2-iminopropanoate deaminase
MTSSSTAAPAGHDRFDSGQVVPPGVPFPEGVRVGELYFLSGQLGNVPRTLKLVDGGIGPEAAQALANIRTILLAQGLDLGHLVRCTVMLADIAEWAEFNETYQAFFTGFPLPARSALGCNGLALGARVEIECIAARHPGVPATPAVSAAI